MKKYLISSLAILFFVLGFVGQAFAETALPPTISSVTAPGCTASYVCSVGSTTVLVVGAAAADGAAGDTTVTVSVSNASFAATTTATAVSTSSFQILVNVSALGEGALHFYASSTSVGSTTPSALTASTDLTKDTVIPTLSSVQMYSNNTITSFAKAGNIATLIASSSEVGTPVITIAGHSATPIGSFAAGWRAVTTMLSTDAIGSTTLSMAFTDTAGNHAATSSAVSSGAGITFYRLPVFTMGGYNPIKINKGTTYTDAGASAVDSYGVTVTLSTLSTVNANVAGNYSVAYGGVDVAGNAATTTRDVFVVAARSTSVATAPVTIVPTDPSVTNVPTTSAVAPTVVASSANPTVATNPVVTQPSVTTNEVSVTVIKVSGVANAITRQLYKGVSNAGVKLLQVLLAKDPTLYPEGLTTGYFGTLTQQAVQRFQEKYGVASAGTPGYGEVGPRTKAKLIEVYGN